MNLQDILYKGFRLIQKGGLVDLAEKEIKPQIAVYILRQEKIGPGIIDDHVAIGDDGLRDLICRYMDWVGTVKRDSIRINKASGTAKFHYFDEDGILEKNGEAYFLISKVI